MEKKSTNQTKTIGRAEQLVYKTLDSCPIDNSDFRIIHASNKQIEDMMIEFAKEHVKHAIKAVYDYISDSKEIIFGEFELLNAYPLENIK